MSNQIKYKTRHRKENRSEGIPSTKKVRRADSQQASWKSKSNLKSRPALKTASVVQHGKHHKRTQSDCVRVSKEPLHVSSSRPSSPSSTVVRDLIRDRLIASISTSFSAKGLPPPSSVDFYKIGNLLGKGAFGKVFLGIHQLTGLKCAIKRIDKSCITDEKRRSKVFQEVFVMNRMTHPNVIRLLEVFESKRHLLIALEYAGGGNLLQLVKARERLSESECKVIFRQVLEAVEACHSSGVAHRDIKLDNILINTELTCVKLCDFGVSRKSVPGEKVHEQCGTPAYLAPEVIVNKGYEPFRADIWSLGVLLYTMLCGSVPFKGKTLNELNKMIIQCKYSFPGFLSDEVKDLIRRILNPMPHMRISLKDMKTHSWFCVPDHESSFEDSAAPRFTGEDTMTRSDAYQNLILEKMKDMGFLTDYVVQSLKLRDINHATATYRLLDLYHN